MKGERTKKDGQLCMTHPGVGEIAGRWANDVLDREPGARIASISADDLGNFCQCERCAATRRQYPDNLDLQVNWPDTPHSLQRYTRLK